MGENDVSLPVTDIVTRIAQRALARRGANYADEVRRLLDAALAVMRERGTGSRPRVADIVAAAGLSNDAFYRHFPSKDALVAALIEDGAERLLSYLAHQMDKEVTAQGKIRRWVEGILAQGADDTAATTRAVLWNAGTLAEDYATGFRSADVLLASLLYQPFAELGSADPEFDAALVAHAIVGKLGDYLQRRVQPAPADVQRMTLFCLRTAAPA